ncbi:hypothetical protein RF819_00265 [Rhodoferax fermentans]|uniref:YagK/YfjJ C-terminal domain-containing protein n=2 Tax=Rhodoferax fermentans TaxID=28066 RepID=A0A1T1AMJ4_RHOFE|nr:hypothetical protein RF819_00265 [Rhodoferax fermentans]
MEFLVDKIIKSNENYFSVKENRFKNGSYIHVAKIGNLIINSLKMNTDELKQHYPMHQFNPYVDLYIKLAEARYLFGMPWLAHVMSCDEVIARCDTLNGLVSELRKIGNSSKFKKKINDFERSSNKNYRELVKYIDKQFEKHSRLLVLRIDFGYLKDQCWPSNTEGAIKHDEVKLHRETLVAYMKRSLPKNSMVGFAWKLEYGLEKSYHYHMLLLLDGSIVREDITIARMIGEYWSKTITNGKGLYWNCNANKSSYKSCGIGMVSHGDSDTRKGLRKAAMYMTKTDYYIKMVTPGNGRVFGKGNMPEPKKGNIGRPRNIGKYEPSNLNRIVC